MHSYGGTVLEDDVYLGHRDEKVPYFINSSGYIKIGDYDVSLKRTRVDFYLIYLINGAGHYILGGDTMTAKAGSIVLYRPGQHQDYYYKGFEKTELYWIHFTGSQFENLLNELELTDGNIFQVGIHREYITLFESIIHELQIKNPPFHQLCTSYLLQLLASYSRAAKRLQGGEKTSGNSNMEKVIKAMNEEFQQEHAVAYYAEMANLSLFQFIRSFKKLTGFTPARYIEKIRIAKARELLRDSSLSIAEISAIAGYRDPFYFSKVFKKASGITPSEYRNSSPNPVKQGI